jgi:flagella basal body P-ring formation protein FlgA
MSRLRTSASLLLLATGAVAASDPLLSLEQRLREQRPDVVRWEIAPIASSRSATPETASISAIGRIGARTAVRFSDGRLRWYAVAGFRSVPVSTIALERGAPVRPQLTELAEREVIASSCDLPVLDAESHWRTERRMAAGEALCAHVLEAPPAVQREKPVTLHARRGAVDVSRSLIAAADARVGESVRLRDRVTGDMLTAIVTGPAEAQISKELR